MKLERATKILDYFIETGARQPEPSFTDAIKLGIEAQKRVDDQRNGKVVPFDRWLPGETEE